MAGRCSRIIEFISIAVLLAIGFIVWGSISAIKYVQQKNFRNGYTSATCLLLNYSLIEDVCHTNNDSPYEYKCYNERFYLSYRIFNNTQINSVFSSIGRRTTHTQTKIGTSYSCYYKRTQVVLVLFDLPSEKSRLIQMCIAFTMVILPILLCTLCNLVEMSRGSSFRDSIISKLPSFVANRLQKTTNTELKEFSTRADSEYNSKF